MVQVTTLLTRAASLKGTLQKMRADLSISDS